MSEEIYLAEIYWEDDINEETIRVPLMAFETLPDAEDYCDKCSEEKQRIQKELKAYWEEHKPEYDKLTNRISEIIYAGGNMLESPEHKRQRDLANPAVLIENSHKYHPMPIYEVMNLTYETTPIDFVPQ